MLTFDDIDLAAYWRWPDSLTPEHALSILQAMVDKERERPGCRLKSSWWDLRLR